MTVYRLLVLSGYLLRSCFAPTEYPAKKLGGDNSPKTSQNIKKESQNNPKDNLWPSLKLSKKKAYGLSKS
jgi:hypothetical protein